MTEITHKADAKDQTPRPISAMLDELFAPVNRSDVPGLVVGVAQHGKLLYRRGFGLASIEHGVANSPRTRMRIGSTSKHFTCLAILLLAEEGKLDINAGIRTYLPELPTLSLEPTLRQMMNHTSGWRCYLDIGFLSDGNVIKPRGSALAAQVRQRSVNFLPGEGMIYCNGGFHLLSIIIDRVAGEPYESFLKQRIFDPVGMVDSASVPSDFEIQPGTATLHIPLGEGRYRRGIFPTEEVRGEGAIISTVDDMLRWIAHLRSPDKIVGSASSWSQMMMPTTLNNGSVNPYGFGLMRHDYRGVEVIHHAGGVIGGSCQMITVPAHGLDVIVLNNGGAMAPTEAANKVIDAVLGDSVLGPVRKLPEAEQFKPMVGTRYFAEGSGFEFGFTEADGKLQISVVNNDGLPLHQTESALVLGFEDVAFGPLALDITALVKEGAAPEKLSLRQSGYVEEYVKLPATPPALAEVGRSLVGRYHADDLDADAQIDFSGDKLMLKVFGKVGSGEMQIEPFSADVFGLKSTDPMLPLRGTLNVQRNGGSVVGFRVDSTRTRKMAFQKLTD